MSFQADSGRTQNINVTNSSVTTALQTPNAPSLELNNNGTDAVFATFGKSSGISTAVASGSTLGGYFVGAGQCKVICNDNFTHVALISPTTGQAFYITPGQGE